MKDKEEIICIYEENNQYTTGVARSYQQSAYWTMELEKARKMDFEFPGNIRFILEIINLKDRYNNIENIYRMDKENNNQIFSQYLLRKDDLEKFMPFITCSIPSCNRAKQFSLRYSQSICHTHHLKTQDGKTIKYFNIDVTGGLCSIIDNKKTNNPSPICYVDDIYKCEAQEARFGGIVVQYLSLE